ncbi:hypothetical protein GF327_00580 [Candidatus Woesearchaeota archaeon]|nr:hypothetical protein [Candidatus Woesearchaeota archaeon]
MDIFRFYDIREVEKKYKELIAKDSNPFPNGEGQSNNIGYLIKRMTSSPT